MASAPNHDDEEDDDFDEGAWLQETRDRIIEYLDSGNVDQYRRVMDQPAWTLPGIVAMWAVESQKYPGEIAFWVISGDVPTDVVERDWKNDDDARTALARILAQWRGWLPAMENGESPDGVRLGHDAEQRREMAGMLASRIAFLEDICGDNSYWDD